MKKYIVKDSLGNILRSFSTYQQADTYRSAVGRPDWSITEVLIRQSTARQKAAVVFCENVLGVKFSGNINDFKQVSHFLSIYLSTAKYTMMELSCEYESYLWDLD